jgi:ElaB/YqjD/DUF883 family membrane-anchored ribosome-binding protein
MKSQTSNEVTGNVSSALHKSIDKVSESMDSAESVIRDNVKNIAEKQKVVVDQARGLIESSPFRSLAIAAASGIVLGWLLGR